MSKPEMITRIMLTKLISGDEYVSYIETIKNTPIIFKSDLDGAQIDSYLLINPYKIVLLPERPGKVFPYLYERVISTQKDGKFSMVPFFCKNIMFCVPAIPTHRLNYEEVIEKCRKQDKENEKGQKKDNKDAVIIQFPHKGNITEEE